MDPGQAFAGFALAVLLPATVIAILWLALNGYA